MELEGSGTGRKWNGTEVLRDGSKAGVLRDGNETGLKWDGSGVAKAVPHHAVSHNN